MDVGELQKYDEGNRELKTEKTPSREAVNFTRSENTRIRVNRLWKQNLENPVKKATLNGLGPATMKQVRRLGIFTHNLK